MLELMVTLTNRQPNNIGQSASGRWNGRVLQFTCSWQSCRQWANRWRLWWRWGPRHWARAQGPARPPLHLGNHWKKFQILAQLCLHWCRWWHILVWPRLKPLVFCNKSVHILWFPSLWCQHNTIFVFWRNIFHIWHKAIVVTDSFFNFLVSQKFNLGLT